MGKGRGMGMGRDGEWEGCGNGKWKGEWEGGGAPTRNLNGKGIQEMVFFTVKDAFLNHP